jgi:hypothetical protein
MAAATTAISGKLRKMVPAHSSIIIIISSSSKT